MNFRAESELRARMRDCSECGGRASKVLSVKGWICLRCELGRVERLTLEIEEGGEKSNEN